MLPEHYKANGSNAIDKQQGMGSAEGFCQCRAAFEQMVSNASQRNTCDSAGTRSKLLMVGNKDTACICAFPVFKSSKDDLPCRAYSPCCTQFILLTAQFALSGHMRDLPLAGVCEIRTPKRNANYAWDLCMISCKPHLTSHPVDADKPIPQSNR